MWVVCNWQVSASSERSLVLRACVSEPTIHTVSPQPADLYAAALPHCLFKSVIFVMVKIQVVNLQKNKKTHFHSAWTWKEGYINYNYNPLRTLVQIMHGKLFELAANWPASMTQALWKTSSTLGHGVISKWVGGMPYITSGTLTGGSQNRATPFPIRIQQ